MKPSEPQAHFSSFSEEVLHRRRPSVGVGLTSVQNFFGLRLHPEAELSSRSAIIPSAVTVEPPPRSRRYTPHSTIRDQARPRSGCRGPSHLSDSPCGAAPSFGRPPGVDADVTRTDTVTVGAVVAWILWAKETIGCRGRRGIYSQTSGTFTFTPTSRRHGVRTETACPPKTSVATSRSADSSATGPVRLRGAGQRRRAVHGVHRALRLPRVPSGGGWRSRDAGIAVDRWPRTPNNIRHAMLRSRAPFLPQDTTPVIRDRPRRKQGSATPAREITPSAGATVVNGSSRSELVGDPLCCG